MDLLPVTSEEVIDEFDYQEEPGYTYKMNVDMNNGTAGQIIGYIDNRDAVEQSVYKILNTERGEHQIYGDQYGVEMDDLFGMPIAYVIPELDRRIRDALLQDIRIESVGNFKFDIPKKGVIHTSFTVTSIYGDLTAEKSVEVA